MTAPDTNETDKLIADIVRVIQEKKGEDIIVINLRGVTSVSDAFIIATGTAGVHVRSIADGIRDTLKKEQGIRPWHIEGMEVEKWVLLDFVDVVVHIFDSASRQFYSLEKLWEDATITRIPAEF